MIALHWTNLNIPLLIRTKHFFQQQSYSRSTNSASFGLPNSEILFQNTVQCLAYHSTFAEWILWRDECKTYFILDKKDLKAAY